MKNKRFYTGEEIDKRYIGRRIKERRMYVRMTQQDLADRLQVPRGTISRWDAGLSVVSSVDLHRVSKALGVPVTFFYGEVSEMEMADEKMLMQYRELPQSRRGLVQAFMETLTKETAAA